MVGVHATERKRLLLLVAIEYEFISFEYAVVGSIFLDLDAVIES